MTTTPIMSMPLPTPLITSGPAWAQLLNGAFTILDGHNHSSVGSKITTAAINIDADFSLNQFSMNQVTSFSLSDQSSTLTGNNKIYSVNGLLYFNSGAGTPIQITTVSGINIASVGTIGGDYGQPGVTASAAYSDTTKTFAWSQSPGIGAKMYSGRVSIAFEGSGENAVTRAAQTGSASYTLEYPLAAPAAGAVEVLDGSGVGTFKVPTGTTNQVTITSTAGALTFSLPQSIHTTGTPTFAGLILTGFNGVVKAASGTLSASALVNADIDAAAAIVDTKLATISTAGKVSNSATTATSANTASAIVARDGNGDVTVRTANVTSVSASSTVNATGGIGTNGSLFLKFKTVQVTTGNVSTETGAAHGLGSANIIGVFGSVDIGKYSVPGIINAAPSFTTVRTDGTNVYVFQNYLSAGNTITLILVYV